MKTTLGRRGKVVNEENVDFFHGTVQFTGGQMFQRRYENNYSKTAHEQADRDRAEDLALGPDMSLQSILGGVREI